MLNGTSRVLLDIKNTGKDYTGKKNIFTDGKQPYRKSMDYLFHENTGSRDSARFTIEQGCVSLAATGLQGDEHIHVMQYIDGNRYAYAPIPGKIIRLSCKLTNIFVGDPGQYQLMLSSPNMVGRVKVRIIRDVECDYPDWIKAIASAI